MFYYMVQAVINLETRQERVVNTVKGQHGFKNKSDAVNFIVKQYEEQILEPELRPEYKERLEQIKNGKYSTFANIDDLRSLIKDA